jgi:hypothetical protein
MGPLLPLLPLLPLILLLFLNRVEGMKVVTVVTSSRPTRLPQKHAGPADLPEVRGVDDTGAAGVDCALGRR